MPSTPQRQVDAAQQFEGRIEAAFDDVVALGAIRAELLSADLSDSDRDDLLGRIEQYKADRQNIDEALAQEAPDGRVGGAAD